MRSPSALPSFVAIAQDGRNGFWRYAAGSILIAATYLGGSVVAVVVLLVASGGGLEIESLFDGQTLPPAGLLAIVLAPSLGLLVGALVVTRLLHRRSIQTLVTAASSVRWRRVALAAALWTSLTALFELLAFAISPENYSWSFEARRFWPVALVAILLIPMQSAAEEIFFRGYLLQGLGVLLRRPWVSVLLTSVGFGLVHASNPEMAQFGSVFLLYYVGMGVLLALVTLLDGGLEIAIGAHVANNLYGALMVSFPGSVLDMPAFFRMGSFPVGLMSMFGALSGLMFYLVLRRVYNWSELSSVLFTGAVSETIEEAS